MATIGSMAAMQLRMAETTTKYGSLSTGLYNKNNNYDITRTKESYDKFWENITKDKNAYIQEQYEKLYNSVFGKEEEDAAESTVSLKGAASNVMASAETLDKFTQGLTFGKEYDTKTAQNHLENFVKDYNTLIDKLGNAEGTSVLQKGVILTNTAKVYSGSLGRAGITVGSDNKLTFDPEKMSDISATDLKTTFGEFGFADKVYQKADQISRAAGSDGFLSYTNTSAQNYAYTVGALFTTYA